MARLTHKHTSQAIDLRHRELFDNISDGIGYLDLTPDGRITVVEINRAGEKTLGLSNAEVAGKDVDHVFPSGIAATVKAKCLECVESGRTLEYDEELDLPEGRRSYHVSLVPIRQEDGLVYRLMTVFHDVTEKKQSERAIHENAERFRIAFENANEGVCLVDFSGRFLRVNAAFCEMLGYGREELESMTFTDITHPDDRELSDRARDSTLEEGTGKARIDKRYMTRDGRALWVTVSTSLVRDDRGQPSLFITHVQNISERISSESALRESEERYRTLVMHSPDAIYVHVNGFVTFANPAMCRLVGAADSSQLLGRSVFSIVHSDIHDLIFKRWETVFSGGVAPLIEEQFVRLDGSLVDVEVNAVALGAPGRREVQVIAREIAERKRIEAALRQSESELKEAQRVGRLGSWEWDAATDKITWSEEYYRIYGIDPAQQPPGYKEHLKVYTRESAALLAAAVQRSMQTGEPYELDLELAHDGGPRRWVTARSEVKRDARGQIAGLRGTSQDITARKRAEEELRKLSHVVEQSPLSVIVTDTDGVIEYVNPEFTITSGFASDEVVGQSIGILMSGQMDAEEYAKLWRTITSGKSWRGEFRSRKKDGELFWESASISPVRSDEGRITHFVGIKEDITERKKAELALRASLQEKNTLLKEIHHRVKNNLQVISSLLSLQADEIADPQLKKAFGESQNRVRSMALVHEQLYRSQSLAAIDFQKYLTEVASRLVESYAIKGVTCGIDVEKVWLDIDRAIPCGLIVNELVTNALKHAFRGRASGRIEVRMRKREGREVELVVADDGSGFPRGVDFFTAKSMGSTIVRMLVDQLEGELRVESGTGTRFEIRFPADQSDGSPIDAVRENQR